MGEHWPVRSGTRWQRCRTSPFETPPAAAPQDEVLLVEAVSWPHGHQDKGYGNTGRPKRPGPIKRTAEQMGEHRLSGQECADGGAHLALRDAACGGSSG